MKYIHKIIVVTIICLLISTSTTSLAFHKNIFRNNNGVDASISCYTINTKGFSTENNNIISYENAQFLLDKIKKLENEIANNPNSIKTKQLQDEIVDIAKKHKLILNDFSFEQISNQMTKRDFPMSFLKTKRSKDSSHASEWFCNFASVGEGSSLPVIILPRFIPILVAPIPRIFMRWQAQDGYTSCGGLLSGTGFFAQGEMNGFALGFWGIGFSIFLPPIIAYGLFGYALFASVNAEDIEFYPPNSKPQISSPNPTNGEENVPITLSEINFRIDDTDNELMSYSVTTDPDIGSETKNNKGNGFYSIPISGLLSSTTYSWTVSVFDGKDATEKTFSFTTVLEAPVVSDPLPLNHGSTSVELSHLKFTINDAQGDLMDYTVETSPYIGSGSASNVPDGTYTVPVQGLEGETWYHWYVNVSDGIHWTRETFSFFTGGLGLVGYWSFDEGSGNIAHDSSGFNNDGTIYGATWVDIGKINGALDFDGNNDYVSIPDDSSLNFHDTNEFSISMWIKRDSTGSSMALISKGTTTPPIGYNLGFRSLDDSIGIGINDGDTSYPAYSSKKIQDNNWHYIACIWDGSTAYFYIDGILDNSTYIGDIYIADLHVSLQLCKHYGRFFDGMLDEVKIFERAINPNEIKELYSNPDS